MMTPSAALAEWKPPIDDDTHPPVESFVPGVVHSESYRGQDAFAPFADGFGQGDEGFHPAALSSRAEPVEQGADLVFGEIPGEDRPKGLLQRVGTPEVTPSALDLAQRGGLVIGQVTGVLQPMAISP
jgi:hypothetical protein